MEQIWYVPILEWSEDINSVNGSSFGTTIYRNLEDLYGFNPEAVGHFRVFGNLPTKSEFDNRVTSAEAWR